MERLRNILVCLWKHSSPSPASHFSNLLELIRKIVCFFNRNKKRAEDFQTAENLLAVTKTPSTIMKATSVSSHLILWIPCAYYTSPVSLLLIVIHRPPHPLGNFLEELNILLILLSIFPTEGTPPLDKLQSSRRPFLLYSFLLRFFTQEKMFFTQPFPDTDINVTLLDISDHHLMFFNITVLV